MCEKQCTFTKESILKCNCVATLATDPVRKMHYPFNRPPCCALNNHLNLYDTRRAFASQFLLTTLRACFGDRCKMKIERIYVFLFPQQKLEVYFEKRTELTDDVESRLCAPSFAFGLYLFWMLSLYQIEKRKNVLQLTPTKQRSIENIKKIC